MREAVGSFGFVCGVIVIFTVGLYGYSTADTEAARWNIAFLFGVIATAGLFGHAVSVRIWRINRFWSVMIGLACGVALLINLSNSLGALVGRGAKTTAETVAKAGHIADDRAELKRLQGRLDALGMFESTDAATVLAAETAVKMATVRRIAECGVNNEKRGTQCKAREEDEAKALTALRTATAAKATTDRANDIEREMRPIRERLRTAGPIMQTNVQGHALAKLFRLPDSEAEFANTLQNFMLAAIVEMIIVLCMVAFELLRQEDGIAPPLLVSEQPTPASVVAQAEPVAATGPEGQAEPLGPAPTPVLTRPRPKLAVTNKQPVGAILDFLAEGVEFVAGSRTEIADAYIGYSSWCRATGHRPMSVADFVDGIESCKQYGVRLDETDANHTYLLDVQLAAKVVAVDSA